MVKTSTCSSCGAHILWTVTRNGRKCPLNVPGVKRAVIMEMRVEDGTPIVEIKTSFVPHWATCPNAAGHRKAPT